MAIDKDISDGTQKVADMFGAELVKRLQRELINAGKLASGALIGEMTYGVKASSLANVTSVLGLGIRVTVNG